MLESLSGAVQFVKMTVSVTYDFGECPLPDADNRLKPTRMEGTPHAQITHFATASCFFDWVPIERAPSSAKMAGEQTGSVL